MTNNIDIAALYEKHFDYLMAVASDWGSYYEARDMIHDVFVWVIENGLNPNQNSREYLSTAVINRCLVSRRKRKYEYTQEPPDRPSRQHETMGEDINLNVGCGKYQRILKLRKYGFDNAEIQRILGISNQNVRTRLHRARKLIA